MVDVSTADVLPGAVSVSSMDTTPENSSKVELDQPNDQAKDTENPAMDSPEMAPKESYPPDGGEQSSNPVAVSANDSIREEEKTEEESKKEGGNFDDEEDDEDDKGTVDAHFYPHWDFVTRWNDLTQKRLDLCRQRVSLEQSLFEYAELRQHRNRSEKAWYPFREPSKDPNSSSSGDADAVVEELKFDEQSAVSTKSSASNYPTLCSVRWEQVNFPDGQIYEGQVLVLLKRTQTQVFEAKKTRRGIFGSKEKLKERTKLVTTTEWIRHGHGCNRWPDGQVFRGSWHWNSRHGRGTHEWPDGRTVTGSWRSGHLHGRIFFAWPDDSTFDGDAAFGKKHGRGVHTWSGGKRVYSGQYEGGYEQGFGTLVESESDNGEESQIKFRGQFKAGRRHGYGVQIWSDKTYDGEWEANVVHGKGKLTWHSTGASYTGNFYAGRYHGTGCYQHPGGRKYIGDWYKGRKHGTGQQFWPNNAVYTGTYSRGKRQGFGRIVYSDGSTYAGFWSKGKRCGHGINVSAIGELIHCGLWDKNRPIVSPPYPLRRRMIPMKVPADDHDLVVRTAPSPLSLYKEAEHALDWRVFTNEETVNVAMVLFSQLDKEQRKKFLSAIQDSTEPEDVSQQEEAEDP